MIQDYLKAGFPGLYVISQDIISTKLKLLKLCTGWRVLFWDCTRGIQDMNHKQLEEIYDPVEAFNYLSQIRNTVLITSNLHLFINSENPDPTLVQTIQHGIQIWKSIGSCLINISPHFKLCPELNQYFTIIDYPLPTSEELYELQKEIAPSNIRPNRKAAHTGALGLCMYDAENAYAYSLIRHRYFSTREISNQKKQILKKSGLLELQEPSKFSEIGGLKNLKDYIINRSKAITNNDKNLPRPKGILLVGVPGTGKSLSAKAVSAVLSWQLVKLDIGALKGSLVGESEKKIRQATKIIDDIENIVVYCDEIEKQFGGINNNTSADGGTSSGMFSHFLTWMQESTSRKFIVATANNISSLPPEFLRAGRFDATFFVDLPTYEERQHIIKIMNEKYNAKIPLEYAECLNGYSGAEIEQLAKDSLYDGLDEALNNIVPISRTMKEEIEALRKWANTRARFANTEDGSSVNQKTRQISATNN